MSAKIQALVFGALMILAFSAGWVVSNWKSESRISLMQKESAEQVARNSAAALLAYQRMEKTKDEAIKAAQDRAIVIKADADRARASVDGMRKQIDSMPARIATATRAAVDEYAATAGELLVACTSEYQWMARKADEHANAERTLIEAWPKQ